jgi:hypothetical protein
MIRLHRYGISSNSCNGMNRKHYRRFCRIDPQSGTAAHITTNSSSIDTDARRGNQYIDEWYEEEEDFHFVLCVSVFFFRANEQNYGPSH